MVCAHSVAAHLPGASSGGGSGVPRAAPQGAPDAVALAAALTTMGTSSGSRTRAGTSAEPAAAAAAAAAQLCEETCTETLAGLQWVSQQGKVLVALLRYISGGGDSGGGNSGGVTAAVRTLALLAETTEGRRALMCCRNPPALDSLLWVLKDRVAGASKMKAGEGASTGDDTDDEDEEEQDRWLPALLESLLALLRHTEAAEPAQLCSAPQPPPQLLSSAVAWLRGRRWRRHEQHLLARQQGRWHHCHSGGAGPVPPTGQRGGTTRCWQSAGSDADDGMDADVEEDRDAEVEEEVLARLLLLPPTPPPTLRPPQGVAAPDLLRRRSTAAGATQLAALLVGGGGICSGGKWWEQHWERTPCLVCGSTMPSAAAALVAQLRQRLQARFRVDELHAGGGTTGLGPLLQYWWRPTRDRCWWEATPQLGSGLCGLWRRGCLRHGHELRLVRVDGGSAAKIEEPFRPTVKNALDGAEGGGGRVKLGEVAAAWQQGWSVVALAIQLRVREVACIGDALSSFLR